MWVFWLFVQVLAGVFLRELFKPKREKGPRSSLDDIQIATQEEGLPFVVVFGTPGRSAHVHVLHYGNLSLVAVVQQDQVVAYYHSLSVHLGLCRAGIDGVQQIWYKDVPMWPTLRDDTALAADGTTAIDVSDQAHFECFGGWRRDGGFSGFGEICYGEPDQMESTIIRQSLASVSGRVLVLFDIITGPWRLFSDTFAEQADH